MLNTFDALANFSADSGDSEQNANNPQTNNNASVDISAIINRLNEMETKINELVNKTTDSNPAPNGGEPNNPAPSGEPNKPTLDGDGQTTMESDLK